MMNPLTSETKSAKRLQMWHKRATFGARAGTDDLNLKTLETKILSELLVDQLSILDAGCGNGTTALEIVKRFPDKVIMGFDYSSRMIEEANKYVEEAQLSSSAEFICINMLDFDATLCSRFDGIYTERSLINLDSFEEQKIALENLARYAQTDARVVLCESFNDGLEEINAFRLDACLDKIERPWHNLYLNLNELDSLLPKSFELLEVLNFSSTYYFVSRVINAWQAHQEGKLPDYDAPLNHLSLKLPTIEQCAQTKALVLRKKRV
jgi:ubiquinone/menaquinone biosynthesis C-methylase UbiE